MTIWFMNNCNNRDHAAMYGRADAFHDAVTDNPKVNERLLPGDTCSVLSRMDEHFAIRQYTFADKHDGTDANDGSPAYVLCGKFVSGQILSREDARLHPIYGQFFNSAGNLNQWSILTKD